MEDTQESWKRKGERWKRGSIALDFSPRTKRTTSRVTRATRRSFKTDRFIETWREYVRWVKNNETRTNISSLTISEGERTRGKRRRSVAVVIMAAVKMTAAAVRLWKTSTTARWDGKWAAAFGSSKISLSKCKICSRLSKLPRKRTRTWNVFEIYSRTGEANRIGRITFRWSVRFQSRTPYTLTFFYTTSSCSRKTRAIGYSFRIKFSTLRTGTI